MAVFLARLQVDRMAVGPAEDHAAATFVRQPAPDHACAGTGVSHCNPRVTATGLRQRLEAASAEGHQLAGRMAQVQNHFHARHLV